MNRKLAWVAAAIMFGTTSCGGDGPGLAGGRGGDGGGAPGGGNPTTVVMGSTSDGSFQQGTVGIGVTNLSSGGSTSLTVQLRTGDGAPYTESVDVTFSSDCQSAGRANIAEPVVTTTIGTATTTYSDLGCAGSDTVTARANVNGELLTATGALTVAEPTLGSIEFVSADPKTIGLKGTGAAGIRETATVKFRVLNDVGGPMPDQNVNFTLSTDVGGLSLASPSAVSGSDGTVSVIVRAGTIPISVRVTATVAETNIATQSSALTVTTAIPDQDSFSISAEVLNPEAWGENGVEVPITIHAADRFNNFVPDDTAIVFTTELGSILGQCLTTNGTCSTTWRSQNPRVDEEGGTTGRTTILAHAIGEESFRDADGDGVFTGSTPCPATPDVDCFYDLPEAWLDENEDGDHDGPHEDIIDFNSNGVHDAADGEWNGVVCGDGGTCTADLINVRAEIVLVMARSTASVLFYDESGNLTSSLQTLDNTGTEITTCVAGAGTFEPAVPATLAEVGRGQPMPAGTTIDFTATVGEIASSKTSWTVLSTNSDVPACYTYVINDGESGDAGSFEVSITTPGGVETFASLPLQDSTAP